MYKDLSPQIQRCNLCFSKENIRSKQNPNPNVAAATEYMRFRSWMTPLEMPLWAPRWYTSEWPKRLCRGSLTYSGRSIVLTIPVDSERIWPLEAPWNYLSIHIKTIQNGLRMWPEHQFWCGLLLDSEMDSNLSFFGPLPWRFEPNQPRASFLIWTP